MGEGPDETVREIEETRERLGAELDELGKRLPTPPAALGNPAVRKAAAGGAGGLAGLLLLRRRRRKRRLRKAADAVIAASVDGAATVEVEGGAKLKRRKPRLRKTRRLLFLGSVAGNAVQYRQLQKAKSDRDGDIGDAT